ncbi:AMP-binding protein [Aquimarina hainanensis]|uniref:AMP-binding protein n=1 Tax=Aquimarina hainanensis TaxID=1578017 RepID=A0ABW5NEM5_9FLAO
MNYITNLYKVITSSREDTAFCIKDTFYSYKQLGKEIARIRNVINDTIPENDKLIGLVTNDDIYTYASILALWFEGKAYVPVNPLTPKERNVHVFELTNSIYVLDSSEKSIYEDSFTVITTATLQNNGSASKPKPVNKEDIAYILFTSGTTGVPKGVPITFHNVESLVNAVDADSEFNLVSSDRCLQMFELTFDFSVVTYLFPLLKGASIYTIPSNAIKYLQVFRLMETYKLTVLTMVPSIINYLRPYYSEIIAPEVRYCSFGGGALHADIAAEWSECISNARIFNYYGPTEFTVYSGYYPYDAVSATKAHNGIISIGRELAGVRYMIVDADNNEVAVGETGELCLIGDQLTAGYWKNKERNEVSFFNFDEKGKQLRAYKTGDLCFVDEEGDFMYVGRADFQVKIRGYRVELAEIEYHAKTVVQKKVNIVALDITNSLGNAELGLAIESEVFELDAMIAYMKKKMPPYMIPTHYKFVDEFPHSINGKINRKELRTFFTQ